MASIGYSAPWIHTADTAHALLFSKEPLVTIIIRRESATKEASQVRPSSPMMTGSSLWDSLVCRIASSLSGQR